MSPRLLAQLALLPDYLGHHMLLTVIALTAGIIICIPLAVLVTRVRSLQWTTLAVAGVLQTIPGIALLALMVPLLGTIGYLPALVALTLYSMLPILRNTVTGIQGVDPAVIEAARGIGMTDRQRLFRVELPLALPVIVAGIRTSAVWVVGTATLSTPVGATSLGNYIFSGLQTQNYTAVLVGCVSAALLAIALDLLIRLAEEGLRHRSRPRLITAGLLMALAFGAGLTPVLKQAEVGKKIVVGAKTFTEQYILSDLVAMRLERSGYSAEAVSSLGSTVLFDALANNSVDCCVDYSGTIWANHMKRTDREPADSLLREMSAWLQHTYGIRCLGALGFENTYALAVPEKLADSLHLISIADLARFAPEMTIASDYEFFSRPEWTTLTETYNLRFRETRTMDHSLMYAAVANGTVQVISAYSTDGWIADYHLQVLTDPRHAFPPYDAVLLVSPKASDDTRLVPLLEKLVGTIDADRMREANKIVDVDGGTVRAAAAFLDSLISAR